MASHYKLQFFLLFSHPFVNIQTLLPAERKGSAPANCVKKIPNPEKNQQARLGR
jgi:hypothetical protein